MKLKYELVIDADRDTVWESFDDADNLKRWQPTLNSYRHLSGEAGRPGMVAELTYAENGRTVVMTETITERRRPDFMAGIYETDRSSALIVNTFETVDGGGTRWTAWMNMSFRGFTKLLSLFLIKSIRRRTEDDMQRFKLMVETDVAKEKQ